MTLRVTFEIVPFGLENAKRTIHTLNIHNIGPAPTDQEGALCEYSFDFDGKAATETVTHFREDGALELTRLILETEYFDEIE